TSIDDFFLPGSQPGQSGTFDAPDNCATCHGNYDIDVEPMYNWQGSMMAHAARDPLYLASLTIANQDAQESGDLCIRCHAPAGWLSGRSEPTDGSALTAQDREGVDCHFCHKLIDPASTNALDLDYLNTLSVIPPQSGNGMYVVDSDNKAKRGPFNDTNAKHDVIYSTFYSESALCATCHDVSNPAFTLAPDGTYVPNDFGEASPTFNTYEMFPVERTYSEWSMSSYNTPGGVYSEVFGGNKGNVSTCQDCHMKDVTGYGCNKNGVPLRNDLPLHDMTGGNTFIPTLVAQLYPNEVNINAINAGIIRAEGMLKNAATMNVVVEPETDGFEAYVEIINETGHKLPSGYPEGRRMWIHLTAYDENDIVIYESGAYDPQTAVLNTENAKIYEAKLGMSQAVADAASADGIKTYTAGESFHFVLNNMIVKDNRIPPRGFTNANFEAIQSAPVGYSYEDGAYSDITEYHLPPETFRINTQLMYQTTSKEYIEFLRDENTTNNLGQEMYDLWANNGKSAPVIMNENDFYTDNLAVSNNSTETTALKIYPNPAKEFVYIKHLNKIIDPISIEIYSINGKRIDGLDKGVKKDNDKWIWKTENVSSGTYIVSFKYENTTISKRVIIRK
ncbi:MAG: T9SS type A sorting domain-containing protein, partial [Flavobacteriaceae bacterium]